ncbi:Guanine nucleotide-binding protein alpha-2 subunit [Pichia californica]|uniref:Guanine nucleotide-binding protein alpha-2 subunit n=1 Tax=Pichia californica TaxID=460514 RepID=A0A9P6WL93_9ASCO|nr:Guanine nucleotide-binding protein alpha-2 subunit [[Candida] californica]KAG0689229.1 Guanine nucleotide-binding protein alpha-2 subunit [[Candida] californica]
MGICGSKDPSKSSATKSSNINSNARNSSGNNSNNNNKNSKNDDSVTDTSKESSHEKVPMISNDSNVINTEQQTQIQSQQRQSSISSSSKLQKKQTLQTVTENVESKLKKRPRTQAKILLLGAGESGKSTILKQIKIIHQNGFTNSEKLDYKPFVFQNICESAQCIIKALKQYNLISEVVNVKSDDLEFMLNYIVPFDAADDNEPFNPKVADIIENLVSDPVVEELNSNPEYEFYILDSANYFFNNLKRIRDSDYLPDITDILRTRKQTSGIFDTKFQMEDLDIHLYDVGGQRSERKKWIHCFDNVTAIIFCVALSEYDQTLLESPTKNRLEESLNLFESVVNSMWFRRSAVILCLNKIDVFIDKLPNSPMEKYFPDYVGGANVNKAVKYILWRFKQLNRANLNLVPYVTQATDTNNIKLAFAIVQETILHNNLVDSGIING